MNVRLLSHSQPTKEFAESGIDNAQELIAYCARVSNPANQLNTETSERLIRYLVKHAHWSHHAHGQPVRAWNPLVWRQLLGQHQQ